MAFLSKILSLALPHILEWIYGKVAFILSKFKAKQDAKEENKKAIKDAEKNDDTSGLFGGSK